MPLCDSVTVHETAPWHAEIALSLKSDTFTPLILGPCLGVSNSTLFETSGWSQCAACSGVLLRRRWCRGPRTARGLAFHGCTQDAVDARLVTPAAGLEPIEHVRVKANGELPFRRGPCNCSCFEKLIPERRNVRIVDLGILHPVKPCQVAFDRFFAHVNSPSSWR